MPQGFYVTTVLQVDNSDNVDDVIIALEKLKKHVLSESNCTMFISQQDAIDEKQIITWERFDERPDFYEHCGKDYILTFFDETKVNIRTHFQANGIEIS